MRALLALLIVAGLAWLAAAPAAERAPVKGDPYAGSDSCKECHAEIHASWAKTAHANTLRDYTPEIVAKPFNGDVFVTRDLEHRVGPGPKITCEGPGGEDQTFDVEMVIGIRRIQMFTTTMPDGRIQVLPVFLEVPKKEWFDYAHFIFGRPRDLEIPPDSPNSWYGPARNFNSRCGGCHCLDYDIGYDYETGRYDTTWRERQISCENCHGPGAAHVAFHQQRRRGDDPIVNPARLSIDRANQVCGRCHAEGELIDPGFLPGEDLFAHVDVNGLEDAKHLFPDGRAQELIHELLPTTMSRCGPISCTQCHDPHGRGIPGDLIRPLTDHWTCTQCHDKYKDDDAVEAHTHHKADGPGSSCFGCHMPRMVIEGGHGRIFDHTVSIPSMANSKRRGLPNACRDCHLAEPPEWEYEKFAEWYPEAEKRNHRVALAAAIGDARLGKVDAKTGLLELLEDPNPVYRAGAAWSLSRHADIDLRPQLEDPHPLVRRAAIKGVAASHPDLLIPLLDDESPVIRNAVADALMMTRISRPYDYIRGHPELRRKLRTVLDGLLKLRPDRYRLHYLIGILEEIDGNTEQALVWYYRNLRFNPWDKKLAAHVARLEKR